MCLTSRDVWSWIFYELKILDQVKLIALKSETKLNIMVELMFRGVISITVKVVWIFLSRWWMTLIRNECVIKLTLGAHAQRGLL